VSGAAEALRALLDAHDFALDPSRIAQEPAAERDGSRLMVLGRDLAEARACDLPTYLRPGDLLVCNEAPVHPARIRARRASGGPIEVLLASPACVGLGAPDDGTWEAMVRPARRLREREVLSAGQGTITLLARHPATWHVRLAPDLPTVVATAGEIPLPPYLHRPPVPADAARYQALHAEPTGLPCAAAPTAGLHFTPALRAALADRGVQWRALQLQVGLGTFQPLGEDQVAQGTLHPERFVIPVETWRAIEVARAEGRRVVAVGTTTLRALESAGGPGPGITRLFVRPGYAFTRVDGLLTNFHLPRSSLLVLACTFAGRDRVLAAYARAAASGYRFYSYGDCMLLWRADNLGAVE
jgi:S-adenosylmethionine:tRNA ribosyltransferase-isomerase